MGTARKITVEVPRASSKKRSGPAVAALPKRSHRSPTGSRIACLHASAPTAGAKSVFLGHCRNSRPIDDRGRYECVNRIPAGRSGADMELLDRALQGRQVLMVPAVLAELPTDAKLPEEVSQTLSEPPLLEVEPGYWQRAGALRAKVLAKRRKARLGDALIAHSCIDHAVPLLTRDRHFRAFAEAAGLDLVLTAPARPLPRGSTPPTPS
jgi:predicted nucleic acid-binding protein